MTPRADALCTSLGIRYPIIQSGMSRVAGPELVAAVSNAGGLGILPALRLAHAGPRAQPIPAARPAGAPRPARACPPHPRADECSVRREPVAAPRRRPARRARV